MKRLIVAAIVLLAASAFSAAAYGQSAQRITFKRGASSAVVTGKLYGYNSRRTFVIRVRKGQTLWTKNAGANYITVSVKAPPGSTYEQDMAADCHDRNEVEPTVSGDYRITVTECMKADAWHGSFKLLVTVR